MTFDFIVGNPPYQEDDSGHGNSSTPVYQHFVESAKRMAPRALSLVIPSRWYTGGKGLNRFRESMLTDEHLIRLVDYQNAKECFPNASIGGGVCYFVWERDVAQDCEITNVTQGRENTTKRSLTEFPVFIRDNFAVSIVRKIRAKAKETLSCVVGSRNPFGLSTSERGDTASDGDAVQLISSQGTSYISRSRIASGQDMVPKWKVMVSRAISEHAGEPTKDGRYRVISTLCLVEPNAVFTDTYIVAFASDDENEAQRFMRYLKTKFVRFLLLQTISSINLTRENYVFVPIQDFTSSSDIDWDKPVSEIDRQLYSKYALSDDEIEMIEARIREMV